VLDRWLRRQTLASFDYQWSALSAGDAMLSDPRFLASVERILVEELLGVERAWFPDRTVLDAGCGMGRWTLGLLRLGCRVLAVDHSASALETVRREMERLCPEAVAAGRLETLRADLLDPPAALLERRFDLVYCFGVLHHTGDTRRALGNLARLVAPDGLLFLYLYGTRSMTLARGVVLGVVRLGLALLPFRTKLAVIARLFPRRDPHQAFDLFSPLVNDRYEHATVEGWLRELGFTDVARTLDHTELYLRACREASSARPFRPPPAPPFWFERFRRA
jgi:SAM-dependent methyltransferase